MTRTIRATLLAVFLVGAFVFGFGVLHTSAQNLPPAETITEPVAESEIAAPERNTAPVNTAEEEPKGVDVTPIVTTIKETLIATLIALLTAAGAWFSAKVNQWTNGRIKLDDTLRDMHMEDYARSAINKALTWAMKRTGADNVALQDVKVRSQVLRYVLDFLMSQYPEVIKWIDKDNDGVIDWIETALPRLSPAGDAPNTAPSALMASGAAPKRATPRRRPAKSPTSTGAATTTATPSSATA